MDYKILEIINYKVLWIMEYKAIMDDRLQSPICYMLIMPRVRWAGSHWLKGLLMTCAHILSKFWVGVLHLWQVSLPKCDHVEPVAHDMGSGFEDPSDCTCRVVLGISSFTSPWLGFDGIFTIAKAWGASRHDEVQNPKSWVSFGWGFGPIDMFPCQNVIMWNR